MKRPSKRLQTIRKKADAVHDQLTLLSDNEKMLKLDSVYKLDKYQVQSLLHQLSQSH